MSISSKNIAAGLAERVEAIGSLDPLIICCQCWINLQYILHIIIVSVRLGCEW